jgi:hypothetical protein
MTRVDLDLKGRESRELLIEIRRLIEEARRQTTVAVNIGLTTLYWRIGKRIQQEILGSERAAYGERLSLHCRDNWLLNLVGDSQTKIFAE